MLLITGILVFLVATSGGDGNSSTEWYKYCRDPRLKPGLSWCYGSNGCELVRSCGLFGVVRYDRPSNFVHFQFSRVNASNDVIKIEFRRPNENGFAIRLDRKTTAIEFGGERIAITKDNLNGVMMFSWQMAVNGSNYSLVGETMVTVTGGRRSEINDQIFIINELLGNIKFTLNIVGQRESIERTHDTAMASNSSSANDGHSTMVSPVPVETSETTNRINETPISAATISFNTSGETWPHVDNVTAIPNLVATVGIHESKTLRNETNLESVTAASSHAETREILNGTGANDVTTVSNSSAAVISTAINTSNATEVTGTNIDSLPTLPNSMETSGNRDFNASMWNGTDVDGVTILVDYEEDREMSSTTNSSFASEVTGTFNHHGTSGVGSIETDIDETADDGDDGVRTASEEAARHEITSGDDGLAPTINGSKASSGDVAKSLPLFVWIIIVTIIVLLMVVGTAVTCYMVKERNQMRNGETQPKELRVVIEVNPSPELD